MVIVVGLTGPQPGQVVATVVVELVAGDDEVPQPGRGEVGPHHHGAQGDGQHAVEEEVHGVTVGCSCSYGSLPVVVGLSIDCNYINLDLAYIRVLHSMSRIKSEELLAPATL